MGRKAACPGYPNKGLAITEEKSAEVQRLQGKELKGEGQVAVRSTLINLGDPKVEGKTPENDHVAIFGCFNGVLHFKNSNTGGKLVQSE